MTLLIKNVKLLCSDLSPEQKTDVFISGENISAIGDFARKGADEVIDGLGGYLSPGFIDVDSTSDHYLGLLNNPEQGDFLEQGVTTIIGGHCGASLAPLLYGSLESFRKWADTDRTNVDWHTIQELMARLAHVPLGVNFATLAGHTTMRRALVGEEVRDLSKNELEVLNGVLERAMIEGALGLSTGLEYVHARGTAYSEILSLAKTVHGKNGLYSTHLRDTGDGIAEALREAVKIYKESGAATFVSHFMPLIGSTRQYKEAVTVLDSLSSDSDFHVGMHSDGGSMIPFYRLLPQWAQNGTIEIMNNGLHDEWLAKRIVKEIPKFIPEDFVVAEAPARNAMVGETLRGIMDMYEIADSQHALLKLLTLSGLQGVAYVQNVDRSLADQMLVHPRTLITSHAPSVSGGLHQKVFRSPRAVDTFPQYLRKVVSRNLLSLPDAVAKITSLPAKKFRLNRRGFIREGYVADLTLMSDFQVKAVMVSGAVAVRDGSMTDQCRGQALLANAK